MLVHGYNLDVLVTLGNEHSIVRCINTQVPILLGHEENTLMPHPEITFISSSKIL
jgi:hypothetical protein